MVKAMKTVALINIDGTINATVGGAFCVKEILC
jgi:hypothetical protein